MHTNFLIFHYNHIISDRLHHTQMTSIRDHELPEIYYKGLPVEMIIGELEIIEDVRETFLNANKKIKEKETDKELSLQLRKQNWEILKQYVTDGPLKMIYKYVRGIKFVCHDENILGNFCIQINSLSQAMAASYDTLISILNPGPNFLKTEHDEEKKIGFQNLYKSLLKFSLRKTPTTLKALDDM